MFGMDGWDIAIMVVAAYIAVTALVRLMYLRRDSLLDELARQVQAEQERRRLEKRREDRKKWRSELRSSQIRNLNEKNEDAA